MLLPLVDVNEGRAPENGGEADAVGAPPLPMGSHHPGALDTPAPVWPVAAPLPAGFLTHQEGALPSAHQLEGPWNEDSLGTASPPKAG